MICNKYTLDEICKSISYGDHQPPPKSDSGIPFVTIANITKTNDFDFSDTMYVPREYYDSLDEKKRPQVGDILYSVVGSFGIPVYIKKERAFVFQRHIAILRPNTEKVIPEFLYYIMMSKDFYMKADVAAVGAAQRTISLASLRNMEVELPEIDVQKKIVAILKPQGMSVDYASRLALLPVCCKRKVRPYGGNNHSGEKTCCLPRQIPG